MFKLRLNSLCFIFISLLSHLTEVKSQDINKELRKWNKLTIKSCQEQLEKIHQSSARMAYQNQLETFIVDENIRRSTKPSKRHEFLKVIWSNIIEHKNFYVIEANQSGEMFQFINLLICLNKDGFSDIYIYIFENNNWIMKPKFRKIHPDILTGDLRRYITKPKQGFNHENVIITRFYNGFPVASEFYLYGTLSNKSGLRNVLYPN